MSAAAEIRSARSTFRQAWLLVRLDCPPQLYGLVEELEESHLALLEAAAKCIEALDTFGVSLQLDKRAAGHGAEGDPRTAVLPVVKHPAADSLRTMLTELEEGGLA